MKHRRHAVIFFIFFLILLTGLHTENAEEAEKEKSLTAIAAEDSADGGTEQLYPSVNIETSDGVTRFGRLLADYRQSDGKGLTAVQKRDGSMDVLHSEDITRLERTSEPFIPMTSDQAGQALLDDLGPNYHLHQTKHFVIAYRTSASYAVWCGKLFESIYSGFHAYQSRRGFSLVKPEFPMTAVLFPNRQEFEEYAQREMSSSEGIAAYYNRNTNRIILYDFSEEETYRSEKTRKTRTTADIEEILSRPGAASNVATVIHEATHQISFNSGLFLRSGPYPLWAVEGLAMFFEVPNARSSQGWNYRGLRGKPNLKRLADLRQTLAVDNADPIREIVAEEKFHDNPLRSYALSWGLYYYLQTKEPEKLSEYLTEVAAKHPFAVWSPEERVADFERVFGTDWEKLHKNFNKFIKALK